MIHGRDESSLPIRIQDLGVSVMEVFQWVQAYRHNVRGMEVQTPHFFKLGDGPLLYKYTKLEILPSKRHSNAESKL